MKQATRLLRQSGGPTGVTTSGKQGQIQAYKQILKDAVESRPSGIRLRIAEKIGKNKSFVSQITNPNYNTPLPEKYIDAILEAVHLTARERERFLELYHQAHPRARLYEAEPEPDGTRILQIELPRLASAQLERKIDRLVRQFARNLIEVARKR